MSVSVIATPAGSSGAVPIEVPAVRPDDLGCLMELPCVPQSAGARRELVRIALAAWSLTELDDTAAPLVTELVANAAKRTGCTKIAISVTRQRESVRVGVRDSSSEVPRRTVPAPEAQSGYGLGLVDALSSRWGLAWAPFGKWVWFELRTVKP
ncbi:ATP-binding protein [Kitasatospora sp. RG8]|uniref:ATP-binding protein n=1 Tax=Kitasatospora sp. RG8 TaxID=2820815 RepID=UPI001ADF173D|nr:ATP-binding protein [Kitasatospora sp. RG8]MBP0453739.1 ATP-binding protein [Kitasatospora sp. RG8]